MKKFALFSIVFLAVMSVSLVACKREPSLPPLPEGVQTLTGTLLPAEISLVRRGTHVLRQNDVDTSFVESSSVNLRRFERKILSLEGTFERNTDLQDLPVLVVSRILNVVEEKVKEWPLRSLGLALEAPETWKGDVQEGKALFSVPGYEHPVLEIRQDLESEELPTGAPVMVDEVRSVRTIDELTGGQRVWVPQGEKKSLVFTFDPGQHPHPDQLREAWLQILSSISFTKKPHLVDTGTGSAADGGTPCGGPAGILCPEGSYCDITFLQENIGVCKKI